MKDKKILKKLGSKAVSGLLFVAACFFAMFILMEFHGNYSLVAVAAVVLLLTAYLFLNALFQEKAEEWSNMNPDDEVFPGRDNTEFRIRLLKYVKESEATQKELLSTLQKQNEMLTEQIENMENEIYMLSEKQVNQTKAVIRFNKENTRQLALSEKETMEKAVQEIKAVLEEKK